MSKVATENEERVLQIIATSPEKLREHSIEQLQDMLVILGASNTKAAFKKKDMINGIINGLHKEAGTKPPKNTPNPATQVGADKEPVVNSAKTVTKAPKGTKPGKTKPDVKPNTPAPTAGSETVKKPRTKAGKAAAAAKATTAPKSSPRSKSKGSDSVELMFPEVIESDKYTYHKLVVENVQELADYLINEPYGVFALLDEQINDELTHFLIAYASEQLLLFVDKSRSKETFMSLTKPEYVNRAACPDPVFVEKDAHGEYVFNLAYYTRSMKGGTK